MVQGSETDGVLHQCLEDWSELQSEYEVNQCEQLHTGVRNGLHGKYNGVLGFFVTEMDFGREIC